MGLVLYGHPFAAYVWKALIALYENETPFSFRLVDRDDPASWDELESLWPMKRFPVLVDGDRVVIEAAITIEYCDRHYPGKRPLLPSDPDEALDARFMGRFFDNYVATPQGAVVFDALREGKDRSPKTVADARATLDTAYAWLDRRMQNREWAAGDRFGFADCAAAPDLFYADWTHPIPERFRALKVYRGRLLAHPSVARVVDEARPYRALFPLGAPDRD